MIIYVTTGCAKLVLFTCIGRVALLHIVKPDFTKRIWAIVTAAVLYLSLFLSVQSVPLINKVMNAITCISQSEVHLGFSRYSWFFFKYYKWLPRFNWNIVESDVNKCYV